MATFRSFRQRLGVAGVAAVLTAGLIAPPAQAMDNPAPAAAPAPPTPVLNFTVTYDPNGGTCTATFSTGPKGAEYFLPTADKCTRIGYTLAGWSSSSTAAAGVPPGASVRLDETKILYAVWSQNNEVNIVTYISDPTSSPSCTEVVELGANATLSTVAKCQPEGESRLVGWNTKPDFTGTQYYAPSAVWTQESFKLDGVGQSVSLYAQWANNCPTVNKESKKVTEPAATDGVQWAGCDLTGANLTFANLFDANLAGAKLTGADLSGAKLRGANLTGAFLKGANLTNANLKGANLTGAFLVNADLTTADLTSADLTGAKLRGADLFDAKLKDADLRLVSSGKMKSSYVETLPKKYKLVGNSGRIYLIGPGVDLTGADLTGVDLSDAKLKGAILADADLKGVDLTGANLKGADLEGADLSDATLTSVDLTGADLTGVDLSGAKMKSAGKAGAILKDVSSGGIKGKPNALPINYKIVRGYFIGPGVDLTGAKLRVANLAGANLKGANLTAMDLTKANLTNANLKGANLTAADLTEASMDQADMTGATLTGAYLTGAYLIGVELSGANTVGVTWLNTTCPDGTVTSTGC